mmetsp:Transcript_85181/g.170436  ORF Transcript_85181/g.170436 Transcript_85181/m.170436 type:complete len:220 (+) Transcript_85181:1711-2370(+)
MSPTTHSTGKRVNSQDTHAQGPQGWANGWGMGWRGGAPSGASSPLAVARFASRSDAAAAFLKDGDGGAFLKLRMPPFNPPDTTFPGDPPLPPLLPKAFAPPPPFTSGALSLLSTLELSERSTPWGGGVSAGSSTLSASSTPSDMMMAFFVCAISASRCIIAYWASCPTHAATMHTPMAAKNVVNTLLCLDVGAISPNPAVVMVTVAKYMASRTLIRSTL